MFRFSSQTIVKRCLPFCCVLPSSTASSSSLFSNKRFQTQRSATLNSNNNDDDDDFVANSAFLNLAEDEQTSSVSSANQKASSSSKSFRKDQLQPIHDDDSTSDLQLQPLGVERLPNIPEGTKISRLNNIVTSKPAPAVYRSMKVSFDEADQQEVDSLLSREEKLKKMGAEGKSFSYENDDDHNNNNNKDDDDAVDPEVDERGDENQVGLKEEFLTAEQEENLELPFDDPNFAETILRMQVEGAIDETWQDTVQAKPEDVAEIVEVLKDSRARDIVAIDVRTKTSNFDFIVVATCESQRHMTLAAWSVSEADKWNRIHRPSRRKADELWDVVPVGRILVNLMVESYRNEVTVERKWAVTKSMDPLDSAQSKVSESRQTRMHGLWTLTMNLQDLEDFEIDYCKDILLSQL